MQQQPRPSPKDPDYFPRGFLLDLADRRLEPNCELESVLLNLYGLAADAEDEERVNTKLKFAPKWDKAIDTLGWDGAISREDAIHLLHGYDPGISVHRDDHQESLFPRRNPPSGIEKRYWGMLKNLKDWDIKYGLDGFPYTRWTLLSLWEWAQSNNFPLPQRFPTPPAYIRGKSTKKASTAVNTVSQKEERILNIQEVAAKISCSRAHIYALIKKSEFPKGISLGGKRSGWRESEIDEWIQQRH